MEKLAIPKVGEEYTDNAKRTLKITEIKLKDHLGREIMGRVDHRLQGEVDYSCTLEMWREIWRDKVEPISASKMKIG